MQDLCHECYQGTEWRMFKGQNYGEIKAQDHEHTDWRVGMDLCHFCYWDARVSPLVKRALEEGKPMQFVKSYMFTISTVLSDASGASV